MKNNNIRINVMIPACGNEQQFIANYWPKNVTEIDGKVMIQHVVESFGTIKEKNYIFILNEKECVRFHTDDMVSILTKGMADIITLENETGGALCTCLMAIDRINNDDELIITNNDHKFDCDLSKIVDKFRDENADSGVICFECIHPRWSYVRVENDQVTEVAEKRPISKCAIAGFYYFRKGKDFVEAAKNAVLKGREHDGKYFISAAINELILLNKKVSYEMINSGDYHTFYEPKQIEKYEQEVRNQ